MYIWIWLYLSVALHSEMASAGLGESCGAFADMRKRGPVNQSLQLSSPRHPHGTQCTPKHTVPHRYAMMTWHLERFGKGFLGDGSLWAEARGMDSGLFCLIQSPGPGRLEHAVLVILKQPWPFMTATVNHRDWWAQRSTTWTPHPDAAGLLQEDTEPLPWTPALCPHLDIFVQVHGLVVNVVLQEVLIHARQQGHLGQWEDIHELLHGVPVRTLWAEGRLRDADPSHVVTSSKRLPGGQGVPAIRTCSPCTRGASTVNT